MDLSRNCSLHGGKSEVCEKRTLSSDIIIHGLIIFHRQCFGYGMKTKCLLVTLSIGLYSKISYFYKLSFHHAGIRNMSVIISYIFPSCLFIICVEVKYNYKIRYYLF